MISNNSKKEFLINLLYFTAICAITFIVFKYLLPVCFPFIIAFILASIVNSFIKKRAENRFFRNHKIVSISLLIIIYAIILIVLFGLVSFLVSILSSLASQLPGLYKDYVQPILANSNNIDLNLPNEMKQYGQAIIDSLPNEISEAVKTVSGWILGLATNLLKSAPNVFVNIMITLISSFFIVLDYDGIIDGINKSTPERIKKEFRLIKSYVTEKLWVVIRSYAMIMGLTFLELCIGLCILRVRGFVGWAFIIAILDILPVLGTGTVLIPWSIISLISGDTLLGIGLFILYIVITVIRNIVEPKFVGTSLGLHPVLTLISMYIGLKLFGIVAMFGFPIAISYYFYITKEKDLK